MNELYKKKKEEQNTELLILLRKKFNLRMQAANGELKKTHLLRKVDRSIARLKTLLTIKVS